MSEKKLLRNKIKNSLYFGTINYHAPVSTTLTLTNTYPTAIEINRVVNHSGAFSVENPLPIQLPQGGTATVGPKASFGSLSSGGLY